MMHFKDLAKQEQTKLKERIKIRAQMNKKIKIKVQKIMNKGLIFFEKK
jgi:hypothetical protein